MGEALTDESIRQLANRSVFIGAMALMVLVLLSLMIKNRAYHTKLYLLMVGVILLVSTLLLSLTLLNVENILGATGL